MAGDPSFEVRGFHAAGYRSLRSIRFPVGRLSVFVGANGVGKTNLYRVLRLLQAAAAGTLARELASEGGMESALWGGKRRQDKPARITLGVGFGADEPRTRRAEARLAYEVSAGLVPREEREPPLAYEISAGLVPRAGHVPTGAAFLFEPQIKEESLTLHDERRPVRLLDRRGPSVMARDEEGRPAELGTELMASETALGSLDDPARFTLAHRIRRTMLDWRFYHEVRTDAAAPVRQPCLAVATPTLSSDAADLAAVFATLVHIREDSSPLDRAIDEAFPGAALVVPQPGRTASFGMIFPDYPKRVFEAAELSDGTLRYLALAGALLAYRLPAFVALNEPETSLHPALLDPLARLITAASERTQIWLVTHSSELAAALARHGRIAPRTVIKRDGETWLEGLTLTGEFREEEE